MDALVIIPTFNERENIESLIDQLLETRPTVHIAVVDDDSPDGTGRYVAERAKQDERVHHVPMHGRVGYGRAVLAGFHFALERGYPRVITMDADFSHEPKYIPDILAALEAGADLVVGSRYTNGVSVVNWPLRRLFLSVFANIYVRTITGLTIHDCTSGYRGISRAVLAAIDLPSIKSNGYSFVSEVNYRAFTRRFKLAEVPIIFVERRKGGSKMSFKVMLEAMFMPWRLRIFG